MTTEAHPPRDLEFVAKTPPGVTRMMSTGLAASIERFEDAGLLSEGKVNLIALDAIVERLGKRWPVRRDQIYDHVDRTLQRHLGLQGYYVRISETDFLICQPELSRFCGQAACLRYLREILTYFIGAAVQADQCVHQVTKISTHEIQGEQVDARQAEQAEARELAASAASAKEAQQARAVNQWSPFVASDGRELRVTATLEPVFELKAFGRIGFRMARRVVATGTEEELTPAMVANLSRADIVRIDLATVARGADRLRADVSGEQQPSLIVPVSFTSLSAQRGRTEIVKMLNEASGLVKQGVICEISDIEGVPQGALLSAASLIRPFSLFVVGRLNVAPPTSSTLAQLKGAGLQALSVECPPRQSETEFMDWAKATIDAAKQVSKSVLVYQAGSSRDAGLAGLLGATHASVRG